jgi:hypothetical protein
MQVRQQRREAHVERAREPRQDVQPRIPTPSLYAADVGDIEVSSLSEPFLRKSRPFTQFPDPIAERRP